MKRVLEIIGKLYIGGAEKVARDIGYYADPSRFAVDYLVFGDEKGVYEDDLTAKGCRIFHAAPPSDGYKDYVRTLEGLIKQNGYDVVHCHTMFSSGWAMWVAKRLGVPVRISHSHSIRIPGRRGFAQSLYERAMRLVILRCSTQLVGCGVDAGRWLFGKGAFERRGITILNGIETEKFTYSEACRSEVRHALGIGDKFVIGHAGHMVKVKNQSFLIELMPEVLKRRPDAVLLLLGDGQDRSMLEQKAKALGLSDKVIMTGNVRDVYRYLSAMDVFAFPSLYEGMPLAMVEVQSNGLPCIISDRVPKDVFLTELLKPLPLEAGAEAWAEAICRAGRSEPEKYGGAMRKSGFDFMNMIEKVYSIYEGKIDK